MSQLNQNTTEGDALLGKLSKQEIDNLASDWATEAIPDVHTLVREVERKVRATLANTQPKGTAAEPQRYSPTGEGGMEIDSLGGWVKYVPGLAIQATAPAPGLTDAQLDAAMPTSEQFGTPALPWDARDRVILRTAMRAGAALVTQASACAGAEALAKALESAMHALTMRGDRGTSPVYTHCEKVLEDYRSQAPAVQHGTLIAPTPLTPRQLEVLEFLCGAGPLEGRWFEPDHKPKYWWRSILREAFAVAAAQPPVQHKENKKKGA